MKMKQKGTIIKHLERLRNHPKTILSYHKYSSDIYECIPGSKEAFPESDIIVCYLFFASSPFEIAGWTLRSTL